MSLRFEHLSGQRGTPTSTAIMLVRQFSRLWASISKVLFLCLSIFTENFLRPSSMYTIRASIWICADIDTLLQLLGQQHLKVSIREATPFLFLVMISVVIFVRLW